MTTATKRYRPAPRPRTTHKLTGGTRAFATSLSFDAELAILYASEWLRRAGGLKVAASGVIRRALLAYALSLDTANAAEELAATRRACTAAEVADDARQMAELRLLSVPADEPLPSLHAIRVGPGAIKAAEEFDESVERLVADVLVSRPTRRKAAA